MIFLDLETTGLIKPGIEDPSQQPQIIEIGAIIWEDGEELNKFTTLINPGVPLPPIITKITGLTDAQLQHSQSFVEVLPDFIDFVYQDPDHAFVAHNLPFDLGCLVFELRRIGWEHRFPYPSKQIDTVPLSGGKKLAVWSKEVIRADAFTEQTHRALDDVRRLIACWESLKR